MDRCMKCGLVTTHITKMSVEGIYDLLRLWHRSCGIVLARYFRLAHPYDYRYLRMVLSLPKRSKDAAACLALHNIAYLAEWSFWIPSFKGTYTHCQAFTISMKLTGRLAGVLETCRDAGNLGTEGEGGLGGTYVFEVPMWSRMGSRITVLSEYAIAESLTCPKCGGNLTFAQQQILPDLNGDAILFKCRSCGNNVKVVFKFRKPKAGEDFIEEWALLALMELLASLSSGDNVPTGGSAFRFNRFVRYVVNEVKAWGNFERFLQYVNLLLRMLYYSPMLLARVPETERRLGRTLLNFLALLITAGGELDIKLPEARDWRAMLRECVAKIASQYVETWRQPSRRHPSYPGYVRCGVPEVVLVVDRNAAGCGRALKALSQELEALLTEFNIGAYEFDVVVADGEEAEASRLTLDELRNLPVGAGVSGKCSMLSPALRKAMELGGGVNKALIVITEGIAPDFEVAYETAEEALQKFAACSTLITGNTPPILPNGWLLGAFSDPGSGRRSGRALGLRTSVIVRK